MNSADPVRYVPSPNGARHDGEDHVDHRPTERALEIAHRSKRQIRPAEPPGASGGTLQRRMAVETRRFDDRTDGSHGAAEFLRVLYGVRERAGDAGGALDIELDAVAECFE